MEKLYYTMNEVASELGERQSCIRFWCDTFPKWIKPKRNAKGNRLFHKSDLDNLILIQHLLKIEGLTIEGALKRMEDEKGRTESDKKLKIINTLKDIKLQLLEIKQYI